MRWPLYEPLRSVLGFELFVFLAHIIAIESIPGATLIAVKFIVPFILSRFMLGYFFDNNALRTETLLLLATHAAFFSFLLRFLFFK